MVARTDYSIAEVDGQKLDEWCQLLSVKTVLEFGPGYSTNFLVRGGRRVTSLESNKEWFDLLAPKLKEMGVELHLFNAALFTLSIPTVDIRHFDFGFVDGPVGERTFSRLNSALYCVGRCNHIALHDTGRHGEKETLEILKALGWAVVDTFDDGKGLTLLTCAGG